MPLVPHTILNSCPTRSFQIALRARLPMLHAQRKSIEPMLYARYYAPDEAWQFFVTDGEPVGADYLFFGLRKGSENEPA